MRFNVEQHTPLGKEVFSTRCMIMGTLTRGDDRWVLQADARARKGTLKVLSIKQTHNNYFREVNKIEQKQKTNRNMKLMTSALAVPPLF